MLAGYKDISISEFFARNKQLLGFSSPKRALLTAVKEAVDNSLDACEEGGILPYLKVEIQEVEKDTHRMIVEDNGPGIPKRYIARVFCRLLFGTRFHQLRQTRGQQGIGISAAGLYAYLTTGEPMRVISKTKKGPACFFEIIMDIEKNTPRIMKEEELPSWDRSQGTRVEFCLAGQLTRGRWSVQEYLEQTLMANPHVTVEFTQPGEKPRLLERVTNVLPPIPKTIQPHPDGLELGTLIELLKASEKGNVGKFLLEDLSGLSPKLAKLTLKKAGLESNAQTGRVARKNAKELYKALEEIQLLPPRRACLSPIGEDQILLGMERMHDGEFHGVSTRAPSVCRGVPFLIEAGALYNDALPAGEPGWLYRFANKVPLLYRSGACALTEAACQVGWRSYLVKQSQGALPEKTILLCHLASPHVPYDSEAKEAIADFPEIIQEVKLAFQACGRQLKTYLRKKEKAGEHQRRLSYQKRFAPHIAAALGEILDLEEEEMEEISCQVIQILEKT